MTEHDEQRQEFAELRQQLAADMEARREHIARDLALV